MLLSSQPPPHTQFLAGREKMCINLCLKAGVGPPAPYTPYNSSLKAGVGPLAPYTPYNPSLKAGVSGYTSYRGFSPDGTAT